MKIGGKELTRNEEILVLPRVDGDIVIRAKSVAVREDFDVLVLKPVAPKLHTKKGFSDDLKDTDYLTQVNNRDKMYFAYLVLRSLEPSEIEWEKVDMDAPNTWLGWEKELMEGGMSEVEIQRVTMCVMAANSLDEDKIREARELFLRGQAV